LNFGEVVVFQICKEGSKVIMKFFGHGGGPGLFNINCCVELS